MNEKETKDCYVNKHGDTDQGDTELYSYAMYFNEGHTVKYMHRDNVCLCRNKRSCVNNSVCINCLTSQRSLTFTKLRDP